MENAMRFLSPEWIHEVNAEIAKDDALPADLPDRECTLVLEIAGGHDLTLRIGPETVSLHPERGEAADATLTYSYETAERMTRGELMPGEGFRAGQIAVKGDLDLLMGMEELFDDIIYAMRRVGCEY
jgi:putative sterol carrier protein